MKIPDVVIQTQHGARLRCPVCVEPFSMGYRCPDHGAFCSRAHHSEKVPECRKIMRFRTLIRDDGKVLP